MIKEESFEVDLATDCSPESSTKRKKRRKNKKQLLMEGVDVMKTKEVGSVGLGESNINSDSNKGKKKKRRKKNTKQSVENSIKAEAGEYESKAENSTKEDSHLSDGGSEKNEKRLIALEDAENERADCVVGQNSGEKILESKDGKSDQRNINLDSDKVKKKKKRKKNTKQSVENSIKAEAGEYESKAENSTKEDSHFFDGGSEKNEKRQIALEEAENERADSIVRQNCGEKILESNNGKSDQRNIKRKKRLLKEAANADMRGICYLSRVPPHMDPLKLRQILSQYGEIQRIYLAPEDAASQIQRKRAGGFRGQFFSEGWVEFTDKRVAKKVANMLNGEQIGGRKRSSFYFDLWNIKYLSKFKWDDLTEETAYKHAIREQKMALEISAAKRERDFYLSKVEKSRALSSIEERLKKKQKLREGSEMNSELADSEKLPKLIRTFPQTQPVADSAVQNKQGLSKNILAGVFGSS